MARKNPAAMRLKQAKGIAERIARHNYAQRLAAFLEPSPKIDWSDQKTRAAHASAALTLREVPPDEPLRKAFKAFGLDPANPWNWRLLLDLLVGTHAEFAPRAGRPPTRNSVALVQLLARHGNRPDAELAALVKKQLP